MDSLKQLGLVGAGLFARGELAEEGICWLLASMACSDGEVHNAELGFLRRFQPGLSDDQLEVWTRKLASKPLDLVELARHLDTVDERWLALRFAARMAWKDGELAVEERALLTDLAGALGLPPGAVKRVLRENNPSVGSVFSESKLLKTMVQESGWAHVQFASGTLVSRDLIAVAPDAGPVARVGLDKVEMMAIYETGVVARFREGAAFLPWSEIVGTRPGSTIGAVLEVITEGNEVYSLVDARLAGFGRVLERLLAKETEKPRKTMVFEQVRGSKD